MFENDTLYQKAFDGCYLDACQSGDYLSSK